MQKWRKLGSEEGQTNETMSGGGHGIKGHVAETLKFTFAFSSFTLQG